MDSAQRKALRRNLQSLVGKCDDYAKLGGCEVGLYITYDDGRFVSYESDDLGWLQNIEAKVGRRPLSLAHARSHPGRRKPTRSHACTCRRSR